MLSTIVSAIAIVVSASIALIAVGIQRQQNRIQQFQSDLEREQANKDFDKEVSEVARGLAHSVAQLFPQELAVQADITGLVVTANKLLSGGAKGTWYLYHNLAMAYANMWEMTKADEYWRLALETADSVRTQITLLTGQASYHYMCGAQEEGRDCYKRAEALLREGPADDITGNQLAMVLTQRAFGEYGVEDYCEAARVYAMAWQQCRSLQAPWRQATASQNLADNLVSTFGQTPEELGGAGLPADLVAYEMAYQRAHPPDQSTAGRLPVPPPGLARWPTPDPSPEPAVAPGATASRFVSTDVADKLQQEPLRRQGL